MSSSRVDVYKDDLSASAKIEKRQQFVIQTSSLKTQPLAAPTSMRALNSWMAFRSYYSKMFTDSQQKDISTYLKTLWNAEQFKAKWSVLAKVYSIIRDVRGKALAPLDKFLDITCPVFGIIPQSEYLDKLNWSFETDSQGKRSLVQTPLPDLTAIDDHYKYSNMTESDIIAYCINQGYMPAAKDVFKNMQDRGQRLMVSLPQFNPTQAKVEFIQEATKDPIGVHAKVFGIEPDSHAFLDLQTPNLLWTGRMSDIYNPEDASMQFGMGMDEEYYNPLDLSNPAQLGPYLNSLGGSLPMIYTENDAMRDQYSLAESM